MLNALMVALNTIGFLQLLITKNVLLYIIPGLMQELYLISKEFGIQITMLEEIMLKAEPEVHGIKQ